MLRKLLVFIVVLSIILVFFAAGTNTVYAATNLAAGKPYMYMFPHCPSSSYTDTNWTQMTDGIYGTNNYLDPAWQGIALNTNDCCYVTVNMRVPTSVTEININFYQNTAGGIYYPTDVYFSYSLDGRYYVDIGDGVPQTEVNSTKKYILTLGTSVNALYVRAVIKGSAWLFTDEIQVWGTSNYSTPAKFSGGKSYTSSDPDSSNYPDTNGTEMTDGVYSTGGYTDSAWSGRDYFGSSSPDYYTQTVDLGANKNVSEVLMDFLKDRPSGIELPANVRVSYSTDNINFTDLGFAITENEIPRGSYKAVKYRLTLPYTVTARYIKMLVMCEDWAFGDELEVYGQSSSISQPGFPAEPTPTPGTFTAKPNYVNVAKGKAYTSSKLSSDSYPDTNGMELTNAYFADGLSFMNSHWVGYQCSSSESFYQVVDLGSSYTSVQGIGVEFMQLPASAIYYPATVSLSYSADNNTYYSLGNAVAQVEIDGKRMYKLSFSNKTARYIKVTMTAISGGSWVFEDEIQVYNGDVQKPVLDGGFITIPIGSSDATWGIDPVAAYTDIQWEKEVDLMKNLGMRYIIINCAANSYIQKTIYPTSITGYSQTSGPVYGLGSSDPIETIMDRADTLGMKVILGGIMDFVTWYQPMMSWSQADRNAWIDSHVSTGNSVTTELYNRYGSHSCFYGFYFADETCDYWMSDGKWQDSRRLYKGMSDYIRSNYPSAKIMICPAAWETSTGTQWASDMYNMLENSGGTPIVDILCIQDGLGRDLAGDPPVYYNFEERIMEVARTVRDSLGIEFWNDTEIFEMPEYVALDTAKMEKALNIESKYSNINICFDITHYLDYQKTSADMSQGFADYKKYYLINK